MVKLTKIYTRTGDDGTTGLGDGERVEKTNPLVEAYGTVDEANAALGVCVVEADRDAASNVPHAPDLARLLRSIQNDLFDVGADLCCPIEWDERAGSRLRVTADQTARLERDIDLHNGRLSPLNSFILPGGSALAAALHVARTVVRRAERRTVLALAGDPGAAKTGGQNAGSGRVNPETVKYLNRLSDLLFVLGRVANQDGKGDVLWVPGANRGP